MKFTSTRDKSVKVGFMQAVLDCTPRDGGMYVPFETEDLRRWITYTDENTSFTSIAGSLTSAFIQDEFSPIICETIATRAFPFAPEIKQLDEKLFLLELTSGPTGMHRDFGISFLVSFLETTLQLKGETATFIDVSTGELGASLAAAIRGSKHLKAVIVYPKGCVRGLEESDFIWNGGNIYPIEVDGAIEDCNKLCRSIFDDENFVKANRLTLANTVNIGRLLPQAFFYPFAFSRIKNKVHSDIVYALAAGNYSNVVAGLYAWQFALPLNGFVIPSHQALAADVMGNPLILDSIVPVKERDDTDSAHVSNLERLEDIFSANQLMMKHFIFPVKVGESEIDAAVKELFMKYKIYADLHTARAYAAAKLKHSDECDECATVLIARDHACYSSDFVRQKTGETPEMPETVINALKKTKVGKPLVKSVEEIKKIIENLK